jgi:hypothetical protein
MHWQVDADLEPGHPEAYGYTVSRTARLYFVCTASIN